MVQRRKISLIFQSPLRCARAPGDHEGRIYHPMPERRIFIRRCLRSVGYRSVASILNHRQELVNPSAPRFFRQGGRHWWSKTYAFGNFWRNLKFLRSIFACAGTIRLLCRINEKKVHTWRDGFSKPKRRGHGSALNPNARIGRDGPRAPACADRPQPIPGLLLLRITPCFSWPAAGATEAPMLTVLVPCIAT